MRRTTVLSSWPVLLSLVLAAPAVAFNDGLGPPPQGLERTSPYLTVDGFLSASHARDYARAAHFLHLDHLPKSEQAQQGERLARRLTFVLDRKLWLDFNALSRDPAGDPADGRLDTLGEIPLGSRKARIRLQPVQLDGANAWVFSEDTVRTIDALFAEHGSPVVERLPPFLFARTLWVLELWQWLALPLLLVLAVFAARLLERVLFGLGSRAAGFTKMSWDDELLGSLRGPIRLPLFAALVAVSSRLLLLPPPAQHVVDLVTRSLAIVGIARFSLAFLKSASALIERRIAAGDEVRSRGVKTQLTVSRRVLEVAIHLVTASLLLIQFESVRNIGVSLLASAGIAGLVIGLAAQKSISTLLAGIQLSVTQPVRIGDTVIVENEWGWIEEITLTYVVVKVWDLRRLVIPMTYFLEKPFQNWSKVSPELLGTVELYVDYRVDVDAVRAELKRILDHEGKALWDGKAQGVQVTEASERTITLRALVSAASSGNQWDLRCLVREKLIAFLKSQPGALPVLRAETTPVPSGEPSTRNALRNPAEVKL